MLLRIVGAKMQQRNLQSHAECGSCTYVPMSENQHCLFLERRNCTFYSFNDDFNIFLCYEPYTILPFILHGCETWSLSMREEHRLRVFENRVLRRIFVPKRDEVAGETT